MKNRREIREIVELSSLLEEAGSAFHLYPGRNTRR
jgi:hypothetical protein